MDHPTLSLGASVEIHNHLLSLEGCRVAIDFTTPNATAFYAREAAERGLPVVIGTTGLSPDQEQVLQDASTHIPVFYSANMSIGVSVLATLVEQAAARLGPEYDIEILDMHHRLKVDAPSGTALMLGAAAATGRHVELNAAKVAGRNGYTGKRVEGTIGFAALRGGDVAGDHTVYFAGEGERLEFDAPCHQPLGLRARGVEGRRMGCKSKTRFVFDAGYVKYKLI